MLRSQQSFNWRQKDENAPQRERPSAGRDISNNNENRIFVGNLPYEAQKEDVSALFKAHGIEVEQVIMSTDPFTGRNPSYCFVQVGNREDVERGIRDLSGQLVLDRPVKVNVATTRSSTPADASPRIKTYQKGYARPGEPQQNRSPSFNSREQPVGRTGARPYDRWNQENDPKSRYEGVEQGRRLYVGGLPRMEPQAAAQAEIEKLFEGYHLEAISKMISPQTPLLGTEASGNHYYCFVDFATVEEATAARDAKNGNETPWGSQLKVNYAKQKTGGKVTREQLNPERPRAEWRKSAPITETD